MNEKPILLIGPALTENEIRALDRMDKSQYTVVKINYWHCYLSYIIPNVVFSSFVNETRCPCNWSNEYLQNPQIERVYCTFPQDLSKVLQLSIDENLDPNKLNFVSLDFYTELENKLKSRPTAGCVTLTWLLQNTQSLIYLYGLNFYLTNYVNTYPTRKGSLQASLDFISKVNYHNVASEQALFLEYQSEERLIVSDCIEKMINEIHL